MASDYFLLRRTADSAWHGREAKPTTNHVHEHMHVNVDVDVVVHVLVAGRCNLNPKS